MDTERQCHITPGRIPANNCAAIMLIHLDNDHMNIEKNGLSNDVAIWRDLWSDGADLARHARAYIAGGLTAYPS